ncbi:uncharacterized protein LOC128245456 [Mya arenaria]|uniref:uncharacterized protein LOC128245456 n=1 Tax=Mya arenaria TaxID=6604 RepID=UPI0022E3BB32|nr:uncharacterized protein LOC128245456 [Mya arenaria]
MASSGETKQNIMAYLYIQLSSKVLLEVLEKYIEKTKPANYESEWTIDEFLFENKSKILSTLVGRKNEKRLFPGFSVRTDSTQWEQYLIMFILLDVCENEYIPHDIIEAIRALKELRQRFYYKLDEEIDDAKFDSQIDEMRNLLMQICESIHNETMKAHVLDQLDRCRTRSLNIEDTDFLPLLISNHEAEKGLREKMETLTAENYEIHENIARVVSVMEQHFFTDIEQAQQQGYDLQDKALPPRSDKYPFSPPNISFELNFEHGKLPQSVIDDIVASINQISLTEESPDPLVFGNAIQQSFVSFGAIAARQGCVRLQLKPNSLKCLFEAIEECISGKLSEKLKPLEGILRQKYGMESLTLSLVLFKDDYTRCMNRLVNQICYRAEMFGSTNDSKQLQPHVSAKCSKEKGVTVTAICRNTREAFNISAVINNGKMQNVFKPLENAVQSIHGNENVQLTCRVTSCKDYPRRPVNVRKRITARLRTGESSENIKQLKQIIVTAKSDTEKPSITGFDVVSGNIVAADLANRCIKLFDVVSGTLIGEPIDTVDKPWEVTAISESSAAVSVPNEGKIIIVKLSSSGLSYDRDLLGLMQCRGLAFHDNTLYVSFGSPNSRIELMSTYGQIRRTISNTPAGVLFDQPWYISVDRSGRILVSEVMKPKLIIIEHNCMSAREIDLHKIMSCPRATYMQIIKGSIYLCGYHPDVLCKIDIDTAETSILLSSDVTEPDCVYIDDKQNQLYLSRCQCELINVYQLGN